MSASETDLDVDETAGAAARLALRAEELADATAGPIQEIRDLHEGEWWGRDQYGSQFRNNYYGDGSEGETAVESILGSCEAICGTTYGLGETAGLGAISTRLADEEDGARFDRFVSQLEGSIAEQGELAQEQRAAAEQQQAELPAVAEPAAPVPGTAAAWAATPAVHTGLARRAVGTDHGSAVFRAIRSGDTVFGYQAASSGRPLRRLANRAVPQDEELSGFRRAEGTGQPESSARWVARQVEREDPIDQPVTEVVRPALPVPDQPVGDAGSVAEPGDAGPVDRYEAGERPSGDLSAEPGEPAERPAATGEQGEPVPHRLRRSDLDAGEAALDVLRREEPAPAEPVAGMLRPDRPEPAGSPDATVTLKKPSPAGESTVAG